MRPELRAVTSELPDPPYPATVKAGTFAFELDWARIKASKTWRLCPPDLRNHLLRIWAESWNEVPAGSWEDDVEMIAAACDIPVNLLVAHRGVLLRNWVRHSDGRLYHGVITEMVLAIEETRGKWRQKRSSRYNSRKSVSGDTPESLPRVSGVSQPSSSSSSSSSSSLRSEEREKPNRAKRKTPTPIPHDWTPGQAAAEYIASFNASPQAQQRAIADFIAYWTAKGDSRANWDLSFIRNPIAKETLAKGVITDQPTRRRLGESING